jgi:outer membrane protein OmpA-like peptidoglycan-associated protein
VLTGNTDLHVLIEVHVLPQADTTQSLLLTLERAKALVLWLRSKGVEKARIEAYGCGGSRPIAPVNGRDALSNDRTEVYVTRPLPKQGMPSTMGCQALVVPSE